MAKKSRQIMDEDDIRRALCRIAHEIVERNQGLANVMLVGMRTRGVPLAERLLEFLPPQRETTVPLGAIDIGLYRDDIGLQGVGQEIKPTNIPTSLNGGRVILVDDVLYTGRSIRAALDELIDFGRPAEIQLAVLVDRGHRQLPIRADYVGKNIPTAHEEKVSVRLKELDGKDEVVILGGCKEN